MRISTRLITTIAACRRKVQALGELTGSNSFIRSYSLILFIFISIMQCLPVLLVIVQRSGSYELLLEATQRREALRARRSVYAAAEGVLLEQVLDRESLNADQAPDRRLQAAWPAATTDETAEEIEDAALRGMLDMSRRSSNGCRASGGLSPYDRGCDLRQRPVSLGQAG